MLPLFSLSPRLRISVPIPFGLIVLGLVLACAQCNAPVRAKADTVHGPRSTLDDCLDAVCRIHGAKHRDAAGRELEDLGTGCVFAIDESADAVYAMTNAHVAGREGGQVTVEFWSQGHASRELPGVVDFAVLRDDRDCDLAVVAVSLSAFADRPPRVIPLADRGLELCAGDAVVSVGCARGAWPSLFRGHIADLENSCTTFVPPVANGRSGSPLLLSDGSRIVGLVGWRRESPGAESVGVAMNLEGIYRALGGGLLASTVHGPRSTVHASELGGRLAPVQQNCPGGNCWRPFGGVFGSGSGRSPAPSPQSPAPNSAWPNRPAPSQNSSTSIDTSQFALKSDLQSLSGRVSTLEKNSSSAVTSDQLDHVLANARADLKEALAGNVKGAVADAASQIKADALAAVESKAHQVVSESVSSKLAPLAEITTSVTAIAAKLGLPAAAAANPLLGPIVTAVSIVTGLLGGAGLVRSKLSAVLTSSSPKAAPGGSAPAAAFHSAHPGATTSAGSH